MEVEGQRDPVNPPDTQARREVEWQLSASDLDRVRKWLADRRPVAGLTFEPRASRTIQDTYLDTDDWRIRRAGFALRLRDEAGRAEATLKDLAPESGGVRIRREFSEPLPSTGIDALVGGAGPVATRVLAVTGPEPLKAIFQVRTERESFAALAHGREPAAEIALDDTVIAAASGESTSYLKRVEVEALSDRPELLESLVGELRTECALEPAADSKYELGLRVAGCDTQLSPARGSWAIDPALSAGEVARANLRRYLASWLAHEPTARLGEDPEELHQLRVAGRRIETTLRMFEPWLPRALARQRPAWKELVRALGGVRDLDLQLRELAAFADGADDDSAARLVPLRARLELERRSARVRMLKTLDRTATRRLVLRMHETLAKPGRPVRISADDPPAAVIAPRLIRQSFSKVRKPARRARSEGTAAAHHWLRRRVKRLRYTIEAFDGFYGDDARRLLRAIARLQSCLGSYQDAHVTAGRLQAMAALRRNSMPPATLFLMGVLSERRCAIAKDAGRRVTGRYAKLRGRRWKKLRRAMDELAASHSAGVNQASAPAGTQSAPRRMSKRS
jgi:CHAD domain-containing protein